MTKYHIALSFAGEDREYVEQTADYLRAQGVDVFYDKFEETKLWGKDLYTYLSDIYQNKAVYTVMFVSEAYKNKLWTNHERENAQARAFSDSKEYILPAMFDEGVIIPGVLKTTGYISLKEITPVEFAQKIIKKLQEDGIVLSEEKEFGYSADAKADADFPMPSGTVVTGIIEALRTHNWYVQSPAISQIFKLEYSDLNHDQFFVLGRNIYQCACGGERAAKDVLLHLRREMAKVPIEVAEHLINGMFYEVYFNAFGNFRGRDLKSKRMEQLFAIQAVEKYSACISFISKTLQPYRDSLLVIPSISPVVINVKVSTSLKDPPEVIDIVCNQKSVLVDSEDNEGSHGDMWKLSYEEFHVSRLVSKLQNEWHIPKSQLNVTWDENTNESVRYRLVKGKALGYPDAL